jgi:PST family polysaccharide transporter
LSQELNKKSGRAVVWSSVTEIMAKLVTPLVNIFLARLLAPEAFGAVATITMVITFAEIFTDAGFQKYIVQHEFENEESLNNSTNVAFWTNFAFSCFVTILIVIFRHPLAKLVGSPELGNAIAIASLSIIMVAFSSIQMARFKRALDFKSLFFVRIGSSLMPLIITIPLAFIFRNFWALVIGTLSVNLFNAVALTVKSKWKPKFFYKFSLFKEMFSFSAWTMLESIVIWLTVNADIFILGNILNNYYLGIYKTSMTTVNSYFNLINSAITPVLFSTLSRCQADDNEFRNVFWRFFKFTAIFIIPMSAGMFLYSDLVVLILLGEQWNDATYFMGLWGLMSGYSIIFCNFASEVYRSKGNPKISTISQIMQILCLVPTVLIASKLNFDTLCLIRALARSYGIIINLIIMWVMYKLKITKMIMQIFPAIVSTLIMSISAVVFLYIGQSVWWQILSIGFCIIIYFLSLLAIFPKVRKELLGLTFVQKAFHRFRIKK